MSDISIFDQQRRQYRPKFPAVLGDVWQVRTIEAPAKAVNRPAHHETILANDFKHTYPKKVLNFQRDVSAKIKPEVFKVGVVLSGGQAPGGHNVICGLYDALNCESSKNELIGFRMGPSGILKNDTSKITKELVQKHINTGGFDMLGSGRTKLETHGDFAKCVDVMRSHGMQTLVIIGGDDSNTNAAVLSEYLADQGIDDLCVIGVPKTIDGDLQNDYLQTSFGFDTAVKLYSELVSNISRDALSAKKYYHFIRLMGRAASHITFDVALQTHPNITLISEEVYAQKKTLQQIVRDMAAVIMERATQGKNYGVVLVPEGLIEYIPEFNVLITELNEVMGQHSEYIETLHDFSQKSEYINQKLSKDATYTLTSLPLRMQKQLLSERDPHGNVQVSRIETEKLIIEMLQLYLKEQKTEGSYRGKFAYQSHFLGYEGRCAAPTNFDANYAYALGRTVAALVVQKVNGYMAVVNRLEKDPSEWQALGVPLISMMNVETRCAKPVAVIKKSLVSLQGPAYDYFIQHRSSWALQDEYRNSGAIQYFGPKEICDTPPMSIALTFKG